VKKKLEKEITAFAESLEGTCEGESERWDADEKRVADFGPFEELNGDALELFDTIVFRCESCGWWCPSSEMTDDQICGDCSENE